MRAAVLAIVLLGAVAAASAVSVVPDSMTWKSCGTGHCPVSKVTMTPDPAAKGKNVTFDVTCNADETVSGGSSVSQVYILGIKVLQQTFDLCDLEKCPQPPGVHTTSGGMMVPSYTPPGTVNMRMNNTDQNHALLSCLDITFVVQ